MSEKKPITQWKNYLQNACIILVICIIAVVFATIHSTIFPDKKAEIKSQFRGKIIGVIEPDSGQISDGYIICEQGKEYKVKITDKNEIIKNLIEGLECETKGEDNE